MKYIPASEVEAVAADWDDGDATWRRAAASLRALLASAVELPEQGDLSEETLPLMPTGKRTVTHPVPDDKLREAVRDDIVDEVGAILDKELLHCSAPQTREIVSERIVSAVYAALRKEG